MSVPSGTITARSNRGVESGRPRRIAAIGVDWWSGGARLAAVACQLALVALILQAWQIDSRSFRWQFVLICAGFVVNHFLPLRLRLPFFASLSIATIGTLTGVANAAYLVGIGLVLITTAHLPIRFSARVVLLAAEAVVLAIWRQSGIIPAMGSLWPILGSMFMFRLLVYMYDLRTGAAPFGPWRALAYFFMVPNAWFPLFPLVDYKTFNRTYYNRDAFVIYQKGIDWILRGIVQLLMYRFIYQNLMIDPRDVSDAGGVAQYLVTNFLLYLRVSGNFHLIVGILHLFGFNLPETHHKYLLSSSFTDFWRRINIYWKDFIQKVFFYPVYFRVKKGGETTAIVVATCAAFSATWALHSYQWFWLRGRWLISWQDMTFWTILAVGVLVNVLYEARATRRRQSLKVRRTWRGELGRALRTMAMFVFICLLWSLWNATSLAEWLTMLGRARFISPLDAAWIVGGLAALGLAAVTMGRSTSERTDAPPKESEAAARREFWRSAAKTASLALALLLLHRNILRLAPTPAAAEVLTRLSSHQLNEQDQAKLERGYYEDLLDEQRFNPELAELYSARPVGWSLSEQPLGYERSDKRYPVSEYFPNARIKLANGAVWTTNRWGMRDRDYDRAKPPGTYRVALLGDSNSAGQHVGDDGVFEHLVEERLNRRARAGEGPACQILNFSVASYGPYARLKILSKVFAFEPDAVLCVSVNDWHWIVRDVGRCLANELDLPDPFIQEIVDRAGLKPGMTTRVVEHRLRPYAPELASWCYAQLAAECRRAGVRPLIAFLPRLDDREWEKDQLPQLIGAAQDAGFTVLDLTGAFREVDDWQTLWAYRWDAHPNAEAHRMIAEALYERLEPLIVFPPSGPEPRTTP